MKKKYTIGLDYGTLSCRALLTEVETGKEICAAVMDYPHGVMDEYLPNGEKLPGDWALQDPDDYLLVMQKTIRDVLCEGNKLCGITKEDVIGIGLDVTSCTMLPVRRDGTPMQHLEPYRNEKHAYIKLWKHHSPTPQAEKLNRVAAERKETFMKRYGGIISPEWMYPKMLETLEQCPGLYQDTDYFMELTDYLPWVLTGNLVRSGCAAGYKALWHKTEGYPSREFFTAVHPDFADAAEKKLEGLVRPVGEKSGDLTEKMADFLGLLPGTAVAVGLVDSHAAGAGLGITKPGVLFVLMGTSAGQLINDREEHLVPGTCGYTEDGIMTGYFGYEAGLAGFGDNFAWFAENMVPPKYHEEAAARKMNMHALLTEKASRLKPGQSGVLALDWWNGNRSILVDSRLSGMFMGMTLTTKPEELYRALLEAGAFATRMIVENYRKHGIQVDRMIATGGIAAKNPLLMQMMADVLHFPIQLAMTRQAGALGSAIAAASAAGSERGGYDSFIQASEKMGSKTEKTYYPDPEVGKAYDHLFELYRQCYELFGTGTTIMHDLKSFAELQNGRENG